MSQANSSVSLKIITVADHFPGMFWMPFLPFSPPFSPVVSWLVSSSFLSCFAGLCSWIYLLKVDEYGSAQPMKHLAAVL